MSHLRTGAHALLEAAYATGVRVCFANPGTTELAIVRAFDDVPGIRPVLGLFEGVCTGAADGYARVSGMAATTLLHLGPGLANGLANLHNARRAHSSVVNVVGDHATWHLPYDAPLTSDIEGLARPVSAAVKRLGGAESIADSVRRAVESSVASLGAVVTVIAPSDVMEAEVSAPDPGTGHAPARRTAPCVPPPRIAEIVAGLGDSAARRTLLLGGDCLTERGGRAAARLTGSVGVRLMMESYPAIVALGGDLPRLERLAYFPSDVRAQLADDTVLLAGARAPVSYFGYPGEPSELVAANRLHLLSAPGEDGALALEQVADVLDRRPRAHAPAAPEPDAPRSPALTPIEVAEHLVAQLPDGAIVSLEGSTCGAPYLQRAHRAPRHHVMTNTGGAIGQGLPCALGAAIARPDARIVCLQSDGSAQYTLQTLWTLAREALNVTIVIAANSRYGILQTELRRAGADLGRPALRRMTDLQPPRIDWVSLAGGYGLPATRATTSAEFAKALETGLRAPGPFLIEAQLP